MKNNKIIFYVLLVCMFIILALGGVFLLKAIKNNNILKKQDNIQITDNKEKNLNEETDKFLDNDLEEYYSNNANVKNSSDLYYKGYKVIGKIEIPAIDIRYPILDESGGSNAINVSVMLLFGPGINKIGNTIIIGQNYDNGLFFGKNKNLKIGQKIYITNMNGKKIEYTIFDKYNTTESDDSYLRRKADKNAEVTLVTTGNTTSDRLIICARADEGMYDIDDSKTVSQKDTKINGNTNSKVTIYINDSASQAEIENLENKLKSKKEIKIVEYISKEKAFEKAIEKLGKDSIEISGYTKENHPFNASFEITINDSTRIECIVNEIEKFDIVNKIYYR